MTSLRFAAFTIAFLWFAPQLCFGSVSSQVNSALLKDDSIPLTSDLLDTVMDDISSSVLTYTTTFFAIMLFLSQPGFAVFETGVCQVKNSSILLFKSLINIVVSTICVYVMTYSFAFGTLRNTGNPFIGYGNFFLVDLDDDTLPATYLLYWADVLLAVAVAGGTLAERTNVSAYVAHTMLLCGWILPTISHWFLSDRGYFSGYSDERIGQNGYLDFARTTTTVLVGAVTGCIGAWWVGPRHRRFDHKAEDDKFRMAFTKHSVVMASLGAFLIWTGYFGLLIGGSPVNNVQISSNGYINIVIAPAGAALTTFCYVLIFRRGEPVSNQLFAIINSLLAGLNSIAPASGLVEPYIALYAGFIGAVLFLVGSSFISRLHIDDPLSSITVHGVCSVWGALVPGLFALEENIEMLYGRSTGQYGLLYGGGWAQLGIQALGVCVIIIWAGVHAFAFFGVMDRLFRCMRVTASIERDGLDTQLSRYGWAFVNIERENVQNEPYSFRLY